MNAVVAPAADTKTRILDAAERVFSEDGFDAASLRTITAAAQVNLAAVNYHFHTKEILFGAVVERRIRPINLRRIQMLETLSGKPTVEKVIEAFVRPPLEITSTDYSAMRPLMARLYSVPSELYTRVLEENFGPLRNRFVDAFAAALPNASREELLWGFFMLVGSMSQIMAWAPYITNCIVGKSTPADVEALIARLVTFGSAGMKATSKRVSH